MKVKLPMPLGTGVEVEAMTAAGTGTPAPDRCRCPRSERRNGSISCAIESLLVAARGRIGAQPPETISERPACPYRPGRVVAFTATGAPARRAVTRRAWVSRLAMEGGCAAGVHVAFGWKQARVLLPTRDEQGVIIRGYSAVRMATALLALALWGS